MAKRSRVPASRLGRLARLGLTAGELAAGGLSEQVRRLRDKDQESDGSIWLTPGNARRLAQRLASMRGAAMKMGQLLSMEGADLLPREFADALAVLRDAGDTMTLTQLRRVLGRAYGRGWEARFMDFDYFPLAAASIGQVHRARSEDGRDMALKIQYPGVARSIGSDIDNLAAFLRLARLVPAELDLKDFVREAKRQLRQEADYEAEASYLERYAALIADQPEFLVPRVHRDYSTRQVLAMDYVTGEPLSTLESESVPQALRDEIGARMEALVFRELFEFRVVQSDPNFANYLYQPDTQRIVLLDFGSTIELEQGFAQHYARLALALMESDWSAARDHAMAIGYLAPDASEAFVSRILALLELVCEPLCHPGVYDFGGSDLMQRARSAGFDLAFDGTDEASTPPPITLFLHRKLMGSFLLCHRLGARVPVAELVRPYLQRCIDGG